jgi:hypothetical protein
MTVCGNGLDSSDRTAGTGKGASAACVGRSGKTRLYEPNATVRAAIRGEGVISSHRPQFA